MKAGNIFVSLLTVPITLKYLSQNEYGAWLTLYSIMAWLMYFDGGLGSGLRNRFTDAKAKNAENEIKYYISTSYFILLITITILIPFFLILNNWVDWSTFLNISNTKEPSFNHTIFIIFTLFCLQFVFRLIFNILIADQRSGEADLMNLLGSALSLLIFHIISFKVQGSFLLVGLVFCGVPVLVNLSYSIYLFLSRYRCYSPSYEFIDLKYYKDLMNLGSKFFIIQICSLVTIGSTNIIISRVLGPSDVVVYNLAYKYFSFILISFTVFTGSIFSSFNEAYLKDDIIWIRNIVRKINFIGFLFSGVILIMIIFSNYVYSLWVGPNIKIPILLSILMGVYYGITIWTTVYATFISGVGKIKIAYYVSIINSIVYIPIALILGNYFGVVGVIFTQIILIISGLYWLPRQYKKLITRTANGIWNK